MFLVAKATRLNNCLVFYSALRAWKVSRRHKFEICGRWLCPHDLRKAWEKSEILMREVASQANSTMRLSQTMLTKPNKNKICFATIKSCKKDRVTSGSQSSQVQMQFVTNLDCQATLRWIRMWPVAGKLSNKSICFALFRPFIKKDVRFTTGIKSAAFILVYPVWL